MIIEAAGGDNQVKANYLSGPVKSWLINLLDIMVQSWDQPCALFIGNFQGTYKWPVTTKTLETIKQKSNENLCDFIKHFFNTTNVILHIQNIMIINAFYNSVTNLKRV
jgi:hypothetical protein